jgi:hypothetical protein
MVDATSLQAEINKIGSVVEMVEKFLPGSTISSDVTQGLVALANDPFCLDLLVFLINKVETKI